jgi:hypothetical protein
VQLRFHTARHTLYSAGENLEIDKCVVVYAFGDSGAESAKHAQKQGKATPERNSENIEKALHMVVA